MRETKKKNLQNTLKLLLNLFKYFNNYIFKMLQPQLAHLNTFLLCQMESHAALISVKNLSCASFLKSLLQCSGFLSPRIIPVFFIV